MDMCDRSAKHSVVGEKDVVLAKDNKIYEILARPPIELRLRNLGKGGTDLRKARE